MKNNTLRGLRAKLMMVVVLGLLIGVSLLGFFKLKQDSQINDAYGHASGDAVLKSLGNLIRWSTRDSDISARIGGDEFAFILPRTTFSQGHIFAMNLLEKARKHDFMTPSGQTLKLSLSMGVVELSEDIHSMEALYGAADKALYESKHRARNQVTCIYKTEFI